MNTSDFYYDLPPELIAQTPAQPRDSSRLLVYDRKQSRMEHRRFYDLPDYLKEGDALVINETKVIPARLMGKKGERAVEFLLLRRISAKSWEIICRPGKKLKIGDTVVFSDKLSAKILDKRPDGVTLVEFGFDGAFEAVLDELGQMPLPPYITQKLADKNRYQTVYANQKGSAAAPTAGLHFTPGLLQKIEDMGVSVVRALLHVGLGTFRPVKAKRVEDHQMHAEYYEMSAKNAKTLNDVRSSGGRVFCVGTTCVRILESAAGSDGIIREASGMTDIYIYPGYEFKAVDALITNFHLPESTLLMLVSAFAGRENTLLAYETAVSMGYRFFSFGDAMLIV